jgi:hypothetical protein
MKNEVIVKEGVPDYSSKRLTLLKFNKESNLTDLMVSFS